jgi:hypothetical protein
VDLFERAKTLADHATARAKEGMEEAKLMLDLRRAYDELGKLSFELAESAELDNPRLQPVVERIRGLEADLKKRRQGSESAGTTDEPSSPSG